MERKLLNENMNVTQISAVLSVFKSELNDIQ